MHTKKFNFIPKDLAAKIKRSKILVVGAGGIGCEILKNLVMCNFPDIEIVSCQTEINCYIECIIIIKYQGSLQCVQNSRTIYHYHAAEFSDFKWRSRNIFVALFHLVIICNHPSDVFALSAVLKCCETTSLFSNSILTVKKKDSIGTSESNFRKFIIIIIIVMKKKFQLPQFSSL